MSIICCYGRGIHGLVRVHLSETEIGVVRDKRHTKDDDITILVLCLYPYGLSILADILVVTDIDVKHPGKVSGIFKADLVLKNDGASGVGKKDSALSADTV